MTSRSRFVFLVSMLVTCLLLPAAPARAWEYAYGPPSTLDQAFRRVAPANCPPYGPGYVAIGTVDQGGLAPDVYVVYTNLAGARIWEIAYDVQGLGLADEGIAIAQLPDAGGFVFLSNSLDGVWSPALTQIRCDGRLTLSRLYPDINGHDLRGRDLIRTVNSDFAVAGVGAMGLGDDLGAGARGEAGHRFPDLSMTSEAQRHQPT